jgi:hypothetical protein
MSSNTEFTPNQIKSIFKNNTEAAKKLGYGKSNITKWMKQGFISEAGQFRIQKYLDSQKLNQENKG